MTLRDLFESLNPKMDKVLDRVQKKPLNPKMDKVEKVEDRAARRKAELTSSGTGKDIRYFTEWYSYPDGSGHQIVQNTDGTLDLYASDDEGHKEMYKDKNCYIGSGYLVKDKSDAHDDEEYSIYKLFKKYINKIPPKAAQNIRDRVNGNKEKKQSSWYRFREYFEEI